MTVRWPGILTSAEFLKSYVPPDYVVHRVLQQGYLYSMTGTTGSGKTSVSLRIAAHVALGLPLGDIEVERGRVLFLAGENPIDICMRWAAMARAMGADLSDVDVHFVPGTFDIKKLMEKVTEWANKIGGASLVVVDTAIAYFKGDNENDNVQMVEYAQLLRSFTTLKGKPCVLVNCHPSKRGNDAMPRGGGSFLNEVDGNLTCRKALGEDVATIGWAEKFRGPPFEPFLMELLQVDGPMVDSKGQTIPTIIAQPLSAMASGALQRAKQAEERLVLAACLENPSAPYGVLAEALGWKVGDGTPYKMKVQRVMRRLASFGFVTVHKDGWNLTKTGNEQKVNGVDTTSDHT